MKEQQGAFDRLFGDWPKWMQRLIRNEGTQAVRGSSKHTRGRKPAKGAKEKRRRKRKAAKYMRRMNQYGKR